MPREVDLFLAVGHCMQGGFKPLSECKPVTLLQYVEGGPFINKSYESLITHAGNNLVTHGGLYWTSVKAEMPAVFQLYPTALSRPPCVAFMPGQIVIMPKDLPCLT